MPAARSRSAARADGNPPAARPARRRPAGSPPRPGCAARFPGTKGLSSSGAHETTLPLARASVARNCCSSLLSSGGPMMLRGATSITPRSRSRNASARVRQLVLVGESTRCRLVGVAEEVRRRERRRPAERAGGDPLADQRGHLRALLGGGGTFGRRRAHDVQAHGGMPDERADVHRGTQPIDGVEVTRDSPPTTTRSRRAASRSACPRHRAAVASASRGRTAGTARW